MNAAPDGYTLLLAPAGQRIYEKLPFNFIAISAPVAGIMRVPNVMEVNPAVRPRPWRVHRLCQSQSRQGHGLIGNGTSVPSPAACSDDGGVDMFVSSYRGAARR